MKLHADGLCKDVCGVLFVCFVLCSRAITCLGIPHVHVDSLS